MDRTQIHKLLQDDLDRARAHHRVTAKQFNAVLNEIPSGIPIPDGSARIRKASLENSIAHTKLMWAMSRMNAFVLHGTVPDDLLSN